MIFQKFGILSVWKDEKYKVGRMLRRSETGEVALVGDMNELGGLCDDCSDGGDWDEYSDDLVPFVGAEYAKAKTDGTHILLLKIESLTREWAAGVKDAREGTIQVELRRALYELDEVRR